MGTVTDIITALEPYEEQISVQVIMAALDTVPFFDLPIINQVTEFLITKLMDFSISKLNIYTVNLATIVQVGLQDKDFTAAAEANLAAQSGSDPNAKAIAAQNVISAARKFVRFNTP